MRPLGTAVAVYQTWVGGRTGKTFLYSVALNGTAGMTGKGLEKL